MLSRIAALLGLTAELEKLNINYNGHPKLPNGAARILHSMPAAGPGIETISIRPGDLRLVEFEPGDTYAGFRDRHFGDALADALILDAFWSVLARSGTKGDELIERHFGSFSGHIFFLGTEFEANDGRACVPFLNIRTHLAQDGRYLCPSTNIINHDVRCCACFLSEKVAHPYLAAA